MRVIERSVYRGPHLYSARPMIRVRLDLGALEQWPTNRLPGFADALAAQLPGLASHGCSYGEPGGFLKRMDEGTWLGHVIEHVAIELQARAGADVTRGKTRSVKDHPGVYDILFCYADERSGLAAARAAIALVAALLPLRFQAVEGLDRLGPALEARPDDSEEIVGLLRKMVLANGLGPSTAALVAEARRRHAQAGRVGADRRAGNIVRFHCHFASLVGQATRGRGGGCHNVIWIMAIVRAAAKEIERG